jgi:serine/threonine-protein kinase RsbW
MMNASSSDQFANRFVLTNSPEQVAALEQHVLDALQANGYNDTSTFAVKLALQEALTNAFKHGHNGNDQKNVLVDCTVSPEQVVLELQDQGDGFDPESVPDPTADENITIPAGRGIMLMRSFMSEVTFYPPGNRVRMVYHKPG